MVAGCLIGAEPRAGGADEGERCEEDFDCFTDLVCTFDDIVDGDSIYYCRVACEDDEECDSDEECDFGACIEVYSFEDYYQ